MKNWILLLLFPSLFFQCASQKSNQSTMESWQYPQPIQYLEILDSLQIAYSESGKGSSTLVFIHGLGSNLKAWEKNIKSLQKNYRCIALDLPGYGKSRKGNYDFDMTFFANAINAFIQKKKLKNVVLVGHSMGGQISVHTLLQKNKNITKLVLLAPAGFERFSQQEYDWFKNFYTANLIKMTTDQQIVKNFELNFHQMPEDARYMVDDRMELKADEKEYDFYCNMIPQCVMGMLNEPVFEQLRKIEIPTLIIYGENDQLIPNSIFHPKLTTLKIANAGHQEIPNSKLVMIPEAGHFANWEKAEAVNTAIIEFLN